MEFEGKSVIVTGGAQGIGQAIALRFASAGARISILDVDVSNASFPGFEDSICLFSGDVANSLDVERFVSDVAKRTGRIDILVNNAGIIRDNVIWRMSEDEFDSVLRVNLKGPWL